MYQDIYLSFSDEAAAKAVLYRIEGAVEASEGVEAQAGYEAPNYANIDTIGVIYKPTGAMEQTDMGEQPVMAPTPGWHVNVRLVEGEDRSALQPYQVNPATPIRVWA